jgi:hypothetical protein
VGLPPRGQVLLSGTRSGTHVGPVVGARLRS